MDRTELLRSVLGDEGYYCVAGIEGKTLKVQKFYRTIEEVVHTADDISANGLEAYFGLGTYEEWDQGAKVDKGRKVSNVNQMRSLFIDVDYGEHHGATTHYATFEEAYSALKTFCKEVGLKQPYIISTGGGLHGYWPLSEPVDVETWLPLADRLKNLCIEHEFRIDPGITIDAARILRVPGTFNYKADEPREVKVLYAKTAPQSVDFFKTVLGVTPSLKRSYARRTEEDDEFVKAAQANRQSRFKTILDKTVAGKGCAQIKYIIEHRKELSEPLWRTGLSIAKFCVDADKAVEFISKEHAGYSPAETDAKVERIKGPYRCDKIRDYMAEQGQAKACTECPFWGKIGSPIALGREVVEADEEDNVVHDKPEGVEDDTEYTFTIPKYPKPYFRGKNGGVYKRVLKDEEVIDVEVYHSDLYVVRRLHDREQGECLAMRLHLPKDGVREFTLTMSAVVTNDEFKKQLSSKGVIVSKPDELRNYILQSVKEMQYQSEAQTAHRQFGWVNDKCDSFVLGDKEIKADRIEYNPPTNATGHLFPAFTKKGLLEKWQQAMNFYNKPGMEVHQFIIGLSFGSIFTHFTAVNAALLHIYSPDSGLGKTTALQAAAGIWGDPSTLVLKDTDTSNSKMLRAEVMKNLLLMMDEVTNALPKELSEFIYPLTSGHQRNRMTSSANGERTRGETWKLMAVSTGNSSIIDKLLSYKAAPKGELMRILEVQVAKVAGLDKADTDELSLLLLNNYGHAAIPYIQYLLNVENLKGSYFKLQKEVDAVMGFSYQERFYSVLITNAMMGLIYARKAGLINFKTKPIMKWLKGVIANSAEVAEAITVNPEDVLYRFWAENYNNTLRIKSTTDLRGKQEDTDQFLVADGTPRGALVLRYEYDVKRLFVDPFTLRDWCTKKQISYTSLLDSLKAGRTKAKIENKRMGKGTRTNLPTTRVITVNCDGWLDEEKEKALAAEGSLAEASDE